MSIEFPSRARLGILDRSAYNVLLIGGGDGGGGGDVT